jgi:cobalt-zinc-cadmium efflux system membrane fusion protein
MPGIDRFVTTDRKQRQRGGAAASAVLVVAALIVGAVAATIFLGRSDSSGQPVMPGTISTPVVGTDEHAEEGPEGEVEIPQAALDNIGLRTAEAQFRPISQVINATGVVGPNQNRIGHVRPLARGRIEETFVELGQRVGRGDPLVAYDNIELGESIGEYIGAMATLREAETRAEVTLQALGRAESLVEAGAIAQAELERRRAEHQDSLAAINRQRAEIDRTDERLHRFGMAEADIEALGQVDATADSAGHRESSHNTLTAPFDGTVIAYDVAAGEVVDSDSQLLTLADLSTVWVLADVYEQDIAAIRNGSTARITVNAYPGEAFSGRIAYISDFLDPATRTATVRAEVDNADQRLKLDMFAAIELPVGGNRETLMIPTSAVQQIEDVPVAFVMEEPGRFRQAPLLLGPESGGWVEVLEGLSEGDVVAAEGSFYVKSSLLREQLGGGHGH